MSVWLPNVNPSYHILISAFRSEYPYSSSASNTSSSVKPNEVAYFSEVVVTTSRLFRSEKIDSLLTLVIPVMSPLSRYGFVYDPPCNQSDRAMTSEKHGFTVYLNYDQSEFSGEVWKDADKGEQLVKIRFNSVGSLVDALHTLIGDMPMIEATEKKTSKSKKEMIKRLINELIDKIL